MSGNSESLCETKNTIETKKHTKKTEEKKKPGAKQLKTEKMMKNSGKQPEIQNTKKNH